MALFNGRRLDDDDEGSNRFQQMIFWNNPPHFSTACR